MKKLILILFLIPALCKSQKHDTSNLWILTGGCNNIGQNFPAAIYDDAILVKIDTTKLIRFKFVSISCTGDDGNSFDIILNEKPLDFMIRIVEKLKQLIEKTERKK